jgi:hypothetical protein
VSGVPLDASVPTTLIVSNVASTSNNHVDILEPNDSQQQDVEMIDVAEEKHDQVIDSNQFRSNPMRLHIYTTGAPDEPQTHVTALPLDMLLKIFESFDKNELGEACPLSLDLIIDRHDLTEELLKPSVVKTMKSHELVQWFLDSTKEGTKYHILRTDVVLEDVMTLYGFVTGSSLPQEEKDELSKRLLMELLVFRNQAQAVLLRYPDLFNKFCPVLESKSAPIDNPLLSMTAVGSQQDLVDLGGFLIVWQVFDTTIPSHSLFAKMAGLSGILERNASLRILASCRNDLMQSVKAVKEAVKAISEVKTDICPNGIPKDITFILDWMANRSYDTATDNAAQSAAQVAARLHPPFDRLC